MNWVDGLTACGKVERGFYTAKQVAAMKKISVVHAGRLLRREVESGRIVVKQFKIKTGAKEAYPVPHYGPK